MTSFRFFFFIALFPLLCFSKSTLLEKQSTSPATTALFQGSSSWGSSRWGAILTYMVWDNWKKGKGLESIDPLIRDLTSSSAASTPQEKLLGCIKVALACVQEDALDTPEMSYVLPMLEGQNVTIPHPKKPGFYVTTSNLAH